MDRREVIFSTLVVAIALLIPGVTQDDLPGHYASLVDREKLKANLAILASDALEGRETGQRGQKMAAAFIASEMEALGLKPPEGGGYLQKFPLYAALPGDTYLNIGGKKFSNFKEIVYYGSSVSAGELKVDVVLAGNGSEEDIKKVNVKDKAVLIVVNSFSYRSFDPPFKRLRDAGARLIFIYSSSGPDAFATFAGKMSEYLKDGKMTLEEPQLDSDKTNLIFVNDAVIAALFGSAEKLRSLSASQKTRAKAKSSPAVTYQLATAMTVVETENVMGFLEGTDKKDEVIVITAHYDHIGREPAGSPDEINNGADDDGSGTVAALEIARVFAKARDDGHGPRRSLLFLAVSAEELGLYGSEYYTAHPVIPLSSTVVNLNMDMIGRWDPEHKGQAAYVYVIGSDRLSSELHEINERNNSRYTKLVLDYTYNDESHPSNLYKRSDHWNFAKHGIPIIFYFDGIHEDYHKPGDEVDKIDFELLARRVQSVFLTAWEVANREERIRVDR